MRLGRYSSDVYLILHFLLGIVSGFYPTLVFGWVILTFFIGVYYAINPNPRFPEYLIAAYLVGLELLGRMSASGVPHEFIKYAVSVIFIVSLLSRSRNWAGQFIFYFILLLPATLLTDGGSLEETRQLISANLSGPLCLTVSVIYFYNRPLNLFELRKIFLSILLPLAAILGYMVIKTPDLSEIEFGYQSNFATSIYGPNQMSSILGLGIIVIGVGYFLRLQLFGSIWVTLALVGSLLFRGLLTFSRGGMLTPLVILFLVFVFLIFKVSGFNRYTIRSLALAVGLFVVGVVSFNYVNDLTDNKLYERYTGKRGEKQVEDLDRLTSGRTVIMALDYQIFKDNMVTGIGVGMGKFVRHNYGYTVEVAAHNEFTRLLAEHGLPGVVALFILTFAPLFRFFNRKGIIEKVLIISLIGFCFVFMTHAATRIAAPCFLYGLAFVRIVPSAHFQNMYGYLFRKHAVKPRPFTGPSRSIGAPA